MSAEKYYEGMLFDYETSNKTYYRDGEITPNIKTVYKAKPSCYRIRPPPLKDIHSLVDWKDARAPPFTLLHRPKDVVRTNPRDVQQPYVKPIDADLEEAKQTRPRLVMTPALSLDNVPSEERKLLIDEIYNSTAQSAMRGAGEVLENARHAVKAPLPGRPAPADILTLPKLLPPYVAPEWRLQSAAWDGRQFRFHCDASKEFYLARTVHCDACDFTAAREAQIKLQKQLKMKHF